MDRWNCGFTTNAIKEHNHKLKGFSSVDYSLAYILIKNISLFYIMTFFFYKYYNFLNSTYYTTTSFSQHYSRIFFDLLYYDLF